jgi:hypothetical protein
MMIRTKIAITGLTPDMTSKAFSTMIKLLLCPNLMFESIEAEDFYILPRPNIIQDYMVRHNQKKGLKTRNLSNFCKNERLSSRSTKFATKRYKVFPKTELFVFAKMSRPTNIFTEMWLIEYLHFKFLILSFIFYFKLFVS